MKSCHSFVKILQCLSLSNSLKMTQILNCGLKSLVTDTSTPSHSSYSSCQESSQLRHTRPRAPVSGGLHRLPHCLEHAPACLLLDILFLQTSAQATFAAGFPWPLDLRLPAPSLLSAPLLSLCSALCFQGTDHFFSFDKFLLGYTFVFFLPPTPSLTERKLQASQEFFSVFIPFVAPNLRPRGGPQQIFVQQMHE